MAAETGALSSATPPCSSPDRDSRVRCRSRRWTAELMGHCKSYMRALGDEQPVEAESLKLALSEAVWVRAAAGGSGGGVGRSSNSACPPTIHRRGEAAVLSVFNST